MIIAEESLMTHVRKAYDGFASDHVGLIIVVEDFTIVVEEQSSCWLNHHVYLWGGYLCT